MDKIFKEMEERVNRMVCGCWSSDLNHLCDQCQVSVDQARLIAALRAAVDGLQKTVDMERFGETFNVARDTLENIDKMLEGKDE